MAEFLRKSESRDNKIARANPIRTLNILIYAVLVSVMIMSDFPYTVQ